MQPPPVPFAPVPTAEADDLAESETPAPVTPDGLEPAEPPGEEEAAEAPPGEEAAGVGAPQAVEPPQEPQPASPYAEPQAWPSPMMGYPGYGQLPQYPPYPPYPQYPYWPEGMQGYGYGFPMMSPYGAYGPYPSFGFFPPMPFFGGYPPYGSPYMPPYGPPPGSYPAPYGAQAPAPYPGAYPQPYGAHKRMKTVYIVLIIVGVLLLIGGAVTAAVLLTGNGKSSFNLGDGSVTGVDIDFKNMKLAQSGSSVTLTGTYDNNTKREGSVIVSVQGISNGNEQLLSFTVPVDPGKGKPFTQKKSSSAKLSGATLGALIYESSTTNPSNSNTYPWETAPSSPTMSTEPTVPSSFPESSPLDQQLDQTTPESTTPY